MTVRPWVLIGLLACSSIPPPETPRVIDDELTPLAGAPLFIGLRLTASPAAITAASPALVPQETEELGTWSATGTHVAHGLTLDTYLNFREGRLASISAHATPANLAEFDALALALQDALGAGAPMECGSDEGISFDEYIVSGRGSRRVRWYDGTLMAEVSLRALSDGRLQLSASATWLPLLPPVDSDFARVTSSPRERHAKEDSTCEEANGRSDFSVLDVPFGASLAEAQALMPDGHFQAGQFSVHIEYVGVPGNATLVFYDDCFATLIFVADDPSVAHYRSMVASSAAWGDAELERCSPDGGAVTEESLGAGPGSLQARWRPNTLAPAISLSSLGSSPRRLALELEYVPLRSRAPDINF